MTNLFELAFFLISFDLVSGTRGRAIGDHPQLLRGSLPPVIGDH